MPHENAYPDDKGYNDSLRSSGKEIAQLYSQVKSRQDYTSVIANYSDALLDKYFYEYFFIAPNFLNANGASKVEASPISIAKFAIPKWKLFLLDTAEGSTGPLLVSQLDLDISVYMDVRRTPGDAKTYIDFYEDSVFNPLTLGRGTNTTIINVRDILDEGRVGYYLFSGKFAQALELAKSASVRPSMRSDIRIKKYLIAAYLSLGKSEEAEQFYKKITSNANDATRVEINYQLREILYFRLLNNATANPAIRNFLRGHDLDPSVGP
jgi:tetratricopeptide (TPR) repeat protein